jgi:hypothetical protein
MDPAPLPPPPPQEHNLPGLGTWASRQRIFDKGFTHGAPIVALPEPARVVRHKEGKDPAALSVSSGENDSELGKEEKEQQEALDPRAVEESFDSLHEAWRWRFARKWQMEQLRQQGLPEPEGSAEPDEDDWNSAMDYMAQATTGLDLQFGRTVSLDRSGSMSMDPGFSATNSMLLASSLSKEMFLSAESAGAGAGTPGAAETPMASRRIARAVHRARELIACQERIEKEVAQRWETAGRGQEPDWAAQRIPAVTIDSWGTFPFILCRLMDRRSNRQKLLVRGANRMTEAQANRALHEEVSAAASTLRLPTPVVDVLGSGNMSWSSQRDRSLNITGTTVYMAVSSQVVTKEDVGRVAGALARTGLSAMHSVVVVHSPSMAT